MTDDTHRTPWSGRTETVREEVLDGERHVVAEQARAVGARGCLDVGCGPQLLAEYLPPDAGYTGVDFEPEWDPDVVADARALPFADGAVPVVTTKTTLQHVPEWRDALAECVRVASEEVVLFERTEWLGGASEVVATDPVLRRRFSMADLFAELTTLDLESVSDGAGASVGWCGTDERIGVYRREV